VLSVANRLMMCRPGERLALVKLLRPEESAGALERMPSREEAQDRLSEAAASSLSET